LELKIRLQPKQKKLLELLDNSPATWIGYGGSRGGAKSHAIQDLMLIRRFKYGATWGAIFRRTWEKVRENHLEPILSRYPFMRPWYNQQNKEITLPNRSVIAFRYGENPKDIDDYIGKQYMDFFADQAEMLTEKELNTLHSCTRWPGVKDTSCKFLLGFNPGNVGHKFLKRIFYDKKYTEMERPQDYAFLQAFGWDNIEWGRVRLEELGISEKEYYGWPEKKRFEFFVTETQYGRDLNALPASLRIGWLLGSMDKFAGQYFDCFDALNNTAAPQELELKPWWPRWISIDWGFAHPSAIYWHAKDGDRIITYRELCISGKMAAQHGEEIGEQELGAKIAELSNKDVDSTGKPIRIQSVFLSPDAYAQRTSQNTVAEEIGRGLTVNGLPYPTEADNDRIGGARLCHQLLKGGYAIISTACSKLLECLSMLVHEDGNEEDVLKVDGDDPYDAWRYGIKSMLSPKDKPWLVDMTERLDAVPDFTQKHMLHKVLEEQHKHTPGIVPLMRPRRLIRQVM
jgi:hypothetical protein